MHLVWFNMFIWLMVWFITCDFIVAFQMGMFFNLRMVM